MSNDFSTDDGVDEGICLDSTSTERVLKPKVTSWHTTHTTHTLNTPHALYTQSPPQLCCLKYDIDGITTTYQEQVQQRSGSS